MLRGLSVVASGLALVLLAGAVPAVHAQVPPRIGDRARLTSPELPKGRAVGVLERVTTDSVVLSGLAVSRSSIDQFEVSTGRESHWLAGSAVGLLVGAGVAAGISCASLCGDVESEYLIAPIAIFGGAMGTLLGALVGGLFIHTDRWAIAPLSTLSIQPVAGHRGSFGIRVGIRF